MRIRVRDLPLVISNVFALKVLIRPDLVSCIPMMVFLALHAALEFFGPLTVKERSQAEQEAREREFQDLKGVVHQITLSLGMRGIRLEAKEGRK